ncbi:hypothetical protein LA438_23990, partial [Escherichia coli]|uniref:conjugal transfer protein TraP n=1 Tax=Escherichia coli TaxID=562 RepID=UPI00295E8CDE
PSETMIWQPEFTDKTLSRKPGAVQTADEHLKEVYTEDTSLSEKIRKCHVYFPDDRANRNNGDKNEHA